MLCEILREYGYEKEDEDRCIKDLSDVLCRKITEKSL